MADQIPTLLRNAGRAWIGLGLLLALALSVRVAAAVKWQRDTEASGRVLRLGDSDSYWILAGHVARGEPYEYGSRDARIFRAPLYPILLAPFTLFQDPSQGVWLARLFGCCCGTWTVWLIMQLASRLVRPTVHWTPVDSMPGAAWCAGLLAAIYPGAIGMSIVVLSETIFCPLMLLFLLRWHRAHHCVTWQQTCSSAILAGVWAGLAILARPSLLLFMPFSTLTLFALDSRKRSRQIFIVLFMAAGTSLAMSPWWIRNAIITARFVPTTLQVGASLFDGLHAGATGASDEDMQFVNAFIDQQRAEDEQLRQASATGEIDLWRYSSFEYRLNARMQAAAWDWANKNISGAIRLSLLKFTKTWSLWPAAGEVGSTGLRAILTIGCFGILLLAAWATLGWMRVRGGNGLDGWLLALCWLPAVYFSLLHMLFVGSIRYREPAVLVLTAVAGAGLQLIMSINQHRHGSPSIERRAGPQH